MSVLSEHRTRASVRWPRRNALRGTGQRRSRYPPRSSGGRFRFRGQRDVSQLSAASRRNAEPLQRRFRLRGSKPPDHQSRKCGADGQIRLAALLASVSGTAQLSVRARQEGDRRNVWSKRAAGPPEHHEKASAGAFFVFRTESFRNRAPTGAPGEHRSRRSKESPRIYGCEAEARVNGGRRGIRTSLELAPEGASDAYDTGSGSRAPARISCRAQELPSGSAKNA